MIQIKLETTLILCLFAPLILSHFDCNCLEYFQDSCCYLQVINLFIFFTADEIVHLVIHCVPRTKTISGIIFPPRFTISTRFPSQCHSILISGFESHLVLKETTSCHVIIFLSHELALIPCLALKF